MDTGTNFGLGAGEGIGTDTGTDAAPDIGGDIDTNDDPDAAPDAGADTGPNTAGDTGPNAGPGTDGGTGVTAVGVDAAPPGVMCDAAVHGAGPQPAAVVTSEETAWCLVHWLAIAHEMQRDGHEIVYTAAAHHRIRAH